MKKDKILIIGGKGAVLKNLQATIGNVVYDCVLAKTGSEAISLLEISKIEVNLVIIFANLSDFSCNSLCKRVDSNIKKIIIYQKATNIDIANSIKMGADYVIDRYSYVKSITAIINGLITKQKEDNKESKKAQIVHNKLYEEKALIEMLQRITVAANEAYSVEEAMHVCISQICAYTKWPIGHMYLFDKKKQRLYSSKLWYLEHPAKYKAFKDETEEMFFKPNIGLPGRVYSSKSVDWVANICDNKFPRSKFAKEAGIKAGFGFPILTQSGVWAVFEFFAEDAKEPDQELIGVMTAVGTQIGRVIERRQASDKIKSAKEQAELVNKKLKLESAKVKKMIKELQETTVSKDYADSIFESIGNMLIVIDNNLIIKKVNNSVIKNLGYKRKELIDQDLSVFFQNKSNKLDKIQKIINNDNHQDIEEIFYTKKDQEVPIIFSWSKIKDKTGKGEGFVCSAQDISSLKNAEKEKQNIQGQLQQLQKMETIGTLAGGIAHDFNNLLVPILGLTDLMLEDTPEDDINYESLKQIYIAADKSKALVEQILIFSRQIEHKTQLVDVVKIIEETKGLIQSSVPVNIEVKSKLIKDAKKVTADPIHILQVLMNLCTNATHAMAKDGGILELRLTQISLTDELKNKYPALDADQYLNIEVIDTGHGMEEVVIERIFDPFFTTKTVGEGTGIGLSVVHGIIKNYGGEIIIKSEVGKGTTFTVLLPVASETEVEEIDDKEDIKGGTETILLVDDEEYVADVSRKMLQRYGYKVNVFHFAEDAIENVKNNPDKYDIVISDYMMPGMSGVEIIDQILKIKKLPVIITTGFSDQLTESDYKKYNIKKRMMKPIVARDLNKAIREIFK